MLVGRRDAPRDRSSSTATSSSTSRIPRVEIPLEALGDGYEALHARRASDPSAEHRRRPRLWEYDFLALTTLRDDVQHLLDHVKGPGVALDLGSGTSPYRTSVESLGFELRTLDVTSDTDPDYVGTAESTGLEAAAFDLVICTQVLEHVADPWAAALEIRRILRPGGRAILTMPHVWFFHPHPHDYWRFTQEGMVRLVEASGMQAEILLAQGGSVLALCQIVNFLLYGIAGRAAAPVYSGLNLLARTDARLSNDLFCLNFACLAHRP
jgi:SAM-dependent methyltransferase